MNLTNRCIAAYCLWMERDGTPDIIQQSYDELRSLYGMKPRELEWRRFLKVESAMCTDSLASIVSVLKTAAGAAPSGAASVSDKQV